MADQVRVTGLPDSGSIEAVALSLTTKIALAETRMQDSLQQDRAYYLRLYHECLKTVRGVVPG